MSNEAAVTVSKDTDVFFTSNLCLEQLDSFLPPWCMAIDSNHFIKIKMI